MSTPSGPAANAERPAAAAYTVANLARLVQCSERHIHRLNDARQIPGPFRVGRLLRFSKSLVDEWLTKGVAR